MRAGHECVGRLVASCAFAPALGGAGADAKGVLQKHERDVAGGDEQGGVPAGAGADAELSRFDAQR